MSTGSNDSITPDEKLLSVHKFTGSSLLLFFDQLLVAFGNWVYWVLISKISSTSEIGQATTIYSVVMLVTTITQLGLEYPLLKKSSTHQTQILGTTLVIEVLITLASVPIVFVIIDNLYQQLLQGFSWIAVGMIVLSSVGFVARFALLGISDVKRVLMIDILGVSGKFLVGYVLLLLGLGTYGILMSILLNIMLVTISALFVASKRFRFRVGNRKYIREIIRDSLANMPSKLSRVLIFSLSIVLLAYLGISSSHIGIFYLALMISIVASGLTSSMAFMIIPPSSESKTDLSSSSLRLGLSFTVPLITALLVAPKSILSIIGAQYISGETILLVLCVGILPSSITINTVSKFNNLNKPRKLILIGTIEILTFLVSFFFLVPHYGTLGSAISIVIAFLSSCSLSLIWSERIVMRYVVVSIISVIAGTVTGHLSELILGMDPIAEILISVCVTLMVIITLKNTSIDEVRHLVKAMINTRNNVRSKIE